MSTAVRAMRTGESSTRISASAGRMNWSAALVGALSMRISRSTVSPPSRSWRAISNAMIPPTQKPPSR